MLILWGCSPVISDAIRREARADLTIHMVKSPVEPYKGTTVIWGGTVYEIRQGDPDPVLEVLHAPLNRGGRPITEEGSSERFLVELSPGMNVTPYRLGMEVTVAGEIVGIRTGPGGKSEKDRPVLRAREIHIWKPSPDPNIRFGIGIGATF